MDEVVIQSVDGPRLTLSGLAQPNADGWYFFRATLEDSGLWSSCVVNDHFDLGNPRSDEWTLTALVQAATDQYRGWEGPKRWASMEEQLWVEVTSDRTGHASFRVRMRENSFDGWKVEATVVLDVMQRERLAKELKQFFERPERR